MRALPFVFFLAIFASQLSASDEGVRGFVGVEPFELRLEALVNIEAFREEWGLGGKPIGKDERQAILDRAVEELARGVKLDAPGNEFNFTDRTARFLVPDPEKGYAEDERESIPVAEAMVGITLSSSAKGVRELEVDWGWFAPKQTRVAIEIASRGRPSARFATREEPTVTWQLDPSIDAPELVFVPSVERETTSPFRYLLLPAFAMLAYACGRIVKHRRRLPAWIPWLAAVGVAVGFAALWVRTDTVATPEPHVAEDIVYSLLRNTYHAFDFRDESTIYDTLEKSVTGTLLEEVYLEVRASLELENVGGARVRVYEIALRDSEMEPAADGDFRSRSEWVTIGEVTHWGHTHERTNKYEANVTVTAVDGAWKISALELLNEERVQKTTRRTAEPET